jgi:hypothetical protein
MYIQNPCNSSNYLPNYHIPPGLPTYIVKGRSIFPIKKAVRHPRGQAIFTITKGQYRHTLILITFLSLSDLAPLVWIFLLRISHPQADSAWKWFLAVAIRGLESLTADTIYRGQEKPKLAPYTSLDLLPA